MSNESEHEPGIERHVVYPRTDDGAELHLVRDALDKKLIDPNHDPVGRVDDVILAVPSEGQPWVVGFQCGPVVRARRVGRRTQRVTAAIARRCGCERGKPMRVDWPHVLRAGLEIMVDLFADQTPALAAEHWLLQHVHRHIPSLKSGKEKKPNAAANAPPPVDRLPPLRIPFRRFRLSELLGLEVRDSTHRAIGRIEEVRGRMQGGTCVIEQYSLGREGLMERLSISGLSMTAISFLGAYRGSLGKHLPWQQVKLMRTGRRIAAESTANAIA
jgi:hypothetical protein